MSKRTHRSTTKAQAQEWARTGAFPWLVPAEDTPAHRLAWVVAEAARQATRVAERSPGAAQAAREAKPWVTWVTRGGDRSKSRARECFARRTLAVAAARGFARQARVVLTEAEVLHKCDSPGVLRELERLADAAWTWADRATRAFEG